MLAGDRFVVVSTDRISFDADTFTKLYLPIIGRDAYALYQVLKISDSGKITFFLEYLNFGPNQFEAALDHLSALDLIKVYDHHAEFYIEMQSPKTYDAFMKDDLLKQLLWSKIDQNRFNQAFVSTDKKIMGQEISKKFYEIYHPQGNESFASQPISDVKKDEESFNMGAFELAMKDQKMTFSHENQDKLMLYQLAQRFDKSWYDLFTLAKTTQNPDATMNGARLAQQLSALTEPSSVLTAVEKPVEELIRVAKMHVSKPDGSDGPIQFLQQLRKNTGGTTSSGELRLLNELKVQSIPDEVQNIMLHYVLVQRKNPTLNAAFLHQLANECLQNQVFTAQKAVTWFMNREKRQKEKQTKFERNPRVVKKSPEWSNANYVEHTTSETKAKFAELQKKMRKENGNGIHR